MTELLRQLSAIADVVVIDGAPVSTVGDALPLIAAVSGVVVVARLDATSKDAVRVLRRIVADAGGRLLGSVATGAATARGSRGGRSG
jgi:Mrp family chromosome partitioning ATPase